MASSSKELTPSSLSSHKIRLKPAVKTNYTEIL